MINVQIKIHILNVLIFDHLARIPVLIQSFPVESMNNVILCVMHHLHVNDPHYILMRLLLNALLDHHVNL